MIELYYINHIIFSNVQPANIQKSHQNIIHGKQKQEILTLIN